jgi:hypothetical protein
MHRDASANQNSESQFAELDGLLSRQQVFVILSGDSVDPAAHKETKDERKQILLWIKQHKTEIKAFIKGMVQIEPNATKRIAAKAVAITFSKFWGFPLILVSSKEEGVEAANNLLSGKL